MIPVVVGFTPWKCTCFSAGYRHPPAVSAMPPVTVRMMEKILVSSNGFGTVSALSPRRLQTPRFKAFCWSLLCCKAHTVAPGDAACVLRCYHHCALSTQNCLREGSRLNQPTPAVSESLSTICFGDDSKLVAIIGNVTVAALWLVVRSQISAPYLFRSSVPHLQTARVSLLPTLPDAPFGIRVSSLVCAPHMRLMHCLALDSRDCPAVFLCRWGRVTGPVHLARALRVCQLALKMANGSAVDIVPW